MIDYQNIIDTYYPEGLNPALRDILIIHSRGVAEMAMEIADKHPQLPIDREFTYAAAMLHDIGIVKCDAPGIECFGKEPYICHGTLGAQMLRESGTEGIEPYARVCERHTGAGLTKDDIVSQQLPLPHTDLLPETLEEQLVCYADKFFSKTHPDVRKPLSKVLKSMSKFGEASLARFMKLHETFA